MKEVTMFYLESCPYCRNARSLMDELMEENPQFRDVPLKMVEERQERDVADSFDYFYVPCYYIGEEKVHEGAADKDDILMVFSEACR